MFRPVRHVIAPIRRQTSLFSRVRQVAAPGVKSAVSDCILLNFVPHQCRLYQCGALFDTNGPYFCSS